MTVLLLLLKGNNNNHINNLALVWVIDI